MLMVSKEKTSDASAEVRVNWRDDPDAESVMGFVDVEWNVEVISLGQIDWDESANNCARMLNPLNDEKIEDYEVCMKRGDVFPRIVVEKTKRGYVILGGNQRCNAVKRIGTMPIEAYVVTALTTAQQQALIRSLNARHGWGTDKQERIAHAVFLVRNHGISVADASRLMIVTATTINQHIRIEMTRASLARHGVDSNRLNLSQLNAIAKIDDEEIQAEFGRVVEKFGPTGEMTKSAAEAVANAPTRVKMATAIKDFTKSLATSIRQEANGQRHVMAKPRRAKFMRLLEDFSEFLERGNDGTGFSSLDELQCSVDVDGDKVRMLAKKITIRLKAITE